MAQVQRLASVEPSSGASSFGSVCGRGTSSKHGFAPSTFLTLFGRDGPCLTSSTSSSSRTGVVSCGYQRGLSDYQVSCEGTFRPSSLLVQQHYLSSTTSYVPASCHIADGRRCHLIVASGCLYDLRPTLSVRRSACSRVESGRRSHGTPSRDGSHP